MSHRPEDEVTVNVGEEDAIDDVMRAIARAPARLPPADTTSGTKWGERGRYVIDRRLGRGGMGTVYLASDTLLGRMVALKVLDAGDDPAEDAQRRRLMREARLAAGIEHERVARVYDVSEHNGYTFVAMEYVRGVTLRTWMNHVHSAYELLAILLQIAEGLKVLHESGIVHRDLKPENVMLPAVGGVKLLDFGLAGHVLHLEQPSGAPSATRTLKSSSAFLGTPGYMAPEQSAGEKADARADIFALGVIAAEMVTGQRPYKESMASPVSEVMPGSRLQLEGRHWGRFPPQFSRAVARMLAPDRDNRYANGTEVLKVLNEVSSSIRPLKAGGKLRAIGILVVLGAAIAGIAPRFVRGYTVHKARAAVPNGMAFINAGLLTVGHTPEELDKECAAIGAGCNRKSMQREVPRGQVDVAPFFLDVNEVTKAEMTDLLNTYAASLVVSEDEDKQYPRYVRFNNGLGHDGQVIADLDRHAGIEYTQENKFRLKPGDERLPVAQITWFGANLYCTTRGKRLPTEDEWEAAARGREDRAYPWGNGPAHCGGARLPADGMMWMDEGCSTDPSPVPVGTAPQDVTLDGVHDLGGNVAEWTSSVYIENDRSTHPDGPGDVERVIRGGSWAPETSFLARSSGRTGRPGSTSGRNLGFRCARSVPGF